MGATSDLNKLINIPFTYGSIHVKYKKLDSVISRIIQTGNSIQAFTPFSCMSV